MQTNCEMCVNYVYNEEEDVWECLVNLDEDDYYKFLSNREFNCSFFRLDDEYGVVRKQN